MIDLYYWTTPNGHKLTMFLEETGLPYALKPVNISRGEQFEPEFLAIAPNNRIPAIVDHAPASTAVRSRCSNPVRSCSISPTRPVGYPARHARALAVHPVAVLADGGPRADGRTEPSFRQLRDRSRFRTRSIATSTRPAASTRCSIGSCADREFIADDYSIADIACYPWIQPERQRQDIDDFPDLERWKESIAARPATQRAYAIAKTVNVKPAISDEESRKILFGQGGTRCAEPREDRSCDRLRAGRYSQRVPAVGRDLADDAKSLGAERLDDRHLAFGKIRRPGERMERIAVADDGDVAASRHRRRQ